MLLGIMLLLSSTCKSRTIRCDRQQPTKNPEGKVRGNEELHHDSQTVGVTTPKWDGFNEAVHRYSRRKGHPLNMVGCDF